MQYGLRSGTSQRVPWMPWTPQLWGTTTDPVLGPNPSLKGRFRVAEGVCNMQAVIQCDTSGVSAGSGGYVISTPINPFTADTSFGPLLGIAWIKVAGSWTRCELRHATLANGRVGFEMRYINAASAGTLTQVTATTPGTLTSNDSIFATACYEVG